MQPFVAALGTELGLTSKDIADIIWLALQMQNSDGVAEPTTSLKTASPEPKREARSRSASPDFTPPIEEKPESKSQQKSAELHQPNANQPSFGQQLTLRVPDARSLREPLSLARSLKPLLRRVVTGWSTTLDEAATVERIADEQLWLPVLKPALEPWLDLALVVDESLSMQIWQRTIAELQRLLSHYGVFRDVRVLGLVTDEQGQVQLYPGMGATARRQAARRPSELIDPSGRRLILLATDCVSSGWQDGSLLPALKLWATSGPVAIVQMLPEWLWSRTGLGFASAVKLQSLLPGVPNQQLIASDVSPWDEIDLDAGIKVPVVTLEPEPFATWTEMVAGKGGVWSPGFVLEEAFAPNKQIAQHSAVATEGSAEQRVQRFRVTASPMARRLAGLLAAAPVISLPVVQIIQDQLLPESRQVHVAEVFLGGLLKPLGEIEAETNPDVVRYEFLDGVRELLLGSVPTSDSVDVLEEVSKFVAERLGLSLDTFAALLRNPQQVENHALADQIRSFATVASQILKTLGGRYAQFAEELERTQDPNPNETTHFYEAKILIVGEGGSGKTSLANKLLDPNYQLKLETEETSTKGIDIFKWEFIGRNGNPYCIKIWDFGGQEVYHQTHQFFFTERSLYLLVADSRKEDTDHYFWLKSVQLLSNNSPVLLIQNEKQNRICNLNFNQLRGEFANLRDTYRVNLADNRGLAELQRAIQYELENLIPNGIPFPNKWLAVRYALANDGRNYIDCADYEATCRSYGITNREEMFQLSRFLHELGICLHFQKDPVLHRHLILKPNWGTAAVYKILDNETVKQNLGQFSDADLEDIWAAPEYADMRYPLLQLMKEFKVCYEIPRPRGQYIAPHLLPANSPAYAWNPEHNLVLRYRYKDFIPKGILTRFIVEMHLDIENVSDPEQALVWKSGVVLTNGAARAEVIEDYPQRQIRIRVSGNHPRSLLTIINRKFEEIHDSFDDRLNYDTLIPCNCTTCKISQDPFAFPLEQLYQCIDQRRLTIECNESGENVNVLGLIDDVILETPDFLDPFEADEREGFINNPNRPTVVASRRSPPRSRPQHPNPSVNPSGTVPIHNHNQQSNQQKQAISNDKLWHGDRVDGDKAMGDKVAGNKLQADTVHGDAIAGNKIIYSQNLAQAAQDIKALLNQLDKDYDCTTPTGQAMIMAKTIEAIEKDPTLKARVVNALKEGGTTALETAIDHPAVKPVVAMIKGFMDAK